MFSFVQDYYSKGLYTDDNLLTLKNGGIITDDEYNTLIDAES
ncbi:XkdX family protein [Pediococcus acidilactici]|nr:XkdX family protein [Pediococcus acidilactici]MCQ0050339.1 XkdX family protein [Pediococcus acidilactici]MCQ0052576.1 XkdX family protein [Pediococcus acidilactici]MCQ0054232.1 XkdX family protein [Pediococcus acidilactici]MCQ0061678.1 XkdX family protein [Pediococcus acidilactici]MCQ0068828.1 XkdX family protein [Pediococcus acidilactici]